MITKFNQSYQLMLRYWFFKLHQHKYTLQEQEELELLFDKVFNEIINE